MSSAAKRILAFGLLTVGGLVTSHPARAQQVPPVVANQEQASTAFQRGVGLHDGGKPAEAIPGTFHDDGNLYYEATQFGSSAICRPTAARPGRSVSISRTCARPKNDRPESKRL